MRPLATSLLLLLCVGVLAGDARLYVLSLLLWSIPLIGALHPHADGGAWW